MTDEFTGDNWLFSVNLSGQQPSLTYLGLFGQAGGDPEALDGEEQEGLRLFLGRGRCTLCHLGPTLSDLEFHNNALPPTQKAAATTPAATAVGSS